MIRTRSLLFILLYLFSDLLTNWKDIGAGEGWTQGGHSSRDWLTVFNPSHIPCEHRGHSAEGSRICQAWMDVARRRVDKISVVQAPWLMPVIPAAQEAQIGRIRV
jgi:hypothetical protein